MLQVKLFYGAVQLVSVSGVDVRSVVVSAETPGLGVVIVAADDEQSPEEAVTL